MVVVAEAEAELEAENGSLDTKALPTEAPASLVALLEESGACADDTPMEQLLADAVPFAVINAPISRSSSIERRVNVELFTSRGTATLRFRDDESDLRPPLNAVAARALLEGSSPSPVFALDGSLCDSLGSLPVAAAVSPPSAPSAATASSRVVPEPSIAR